MTMTTNNESNFSDDDLAGLSEEERLAVTEGRDEEETPPIEQEETPPIEQEETPPIEQEEAPPIEQEGSPKAQSHTQPFVPQFNFQADYDAAKFNEAIAELDGNIAKVRADYQDGEIGEADHFQRLSELMGKKNELTTQKAIADYSQQMAQQFNQQSQQQLWQYEQKIFFDQYPLYKTDLVSKSALQGVFADLEAREDSANKTGLELLHEARQIVEQSRFGGQQQEPRQQPVQTSAKVPAMQKNPPPQTLAFTPQADRNSVEKDDFAHLDNMDGIELERALSKMSGDQAERYLRVGMAT